MEELQELNENKEIATNAMCTFLAINTSSVQIILPATVIALMGATANQIFITTILATGFSTTVAIISVKFFEKNEKVFSYPKKERVMIDSFVVFTNQFSRYIIPFLLVSIPFYGLFFRKIKVYELFVDGAKDGFTIAVRIIPYLVAILVAIGMFRASGALNILLIWLTPFLNFVGFPPENLPLALMRPLSGSGSLGLLTDLIDQHGQDSLISKIGATMYGSTETTFYVLAVYFGSVGIKKSRHALISGLLADLAGIIAAVFLCQILLEIQLFPKAVLKIKYNMFKDLKKNTILLSRSMFKTLRFSIMLKTVPLIIIISCGEDQRMETVFNKELKNISRYTPDKTLDVFYKFKKNNSNWVLNGETTDKIAFTLILMRLQIHYLIRLTL